MCSTLTFHLLRSAAVNFYVIHPYMTSYLNSIDTSSLSLVFEIFDFKLFRVWPWPRTFRDHLRSFFIPSWTLIHDFISNSHWRFLPTLSRTVFWDIGLQTDKDLTLTFELHRSSEVNLFYIIRWPIHDFLSNFSYHFVSISYCFWDIWLQTF